MGSKIGFILVVILISASFVGAISVAKLLYKPDLTDYTAQAQKIFNQARTEIEQIRNVTLPQVELQVVTRQWAIDTWGKGYADADLTNILRQERVYKGLFMMSESDSLYQASVDWAGNFGAATWGGKIYVVKENFDPWDMPGAEATFVHELTHIWQHGLSSPGSFDADKAHTALVEGDASFMGDFYKNQTKVSANPMNVVVDQVPWILIDNSLLDELHPSIPSAISHLNYFPYDYGTIFIDALHKQGGWATVNQAYQLGYTPSTTEQIMHPDKYFANETAQSVSAPTLTEDTWTIVKTNYNENHNTYGEYFIQNMLGNWLNQNESQKAAAGWAGDNFTYYERGNEYLFTWNIQWDSSSDASEFYVAFHNMMNATDAAGDNSSHWSANGRYLMIEWNQNSNPILIAVSSNQTTVQESYFT
jgi:hypothetical protein